MRGEGLSSGASVAGQPQRENRPAEGPGGVGVEVGVDGSLRVLGAVACGGAEAARRGVGLHLVQVLPPSGGSDIEPAVPRGRAPALLHRATGAVATVAPDVPITLATVYGKAGPALVTYASRAQVLVVGSHDVGSVPPLGSTSQELLRDSPCAVAVLSPRTPSPRPRGQGALPASAAPGPTQQSGGDVEDQASVIPS